MTFLYVNLYIKFRYLLKTPKFHENSDHQSQGHGAGAQSQSTLEPCFL